MDRVGSKSKPFVDENALGNRLDNRIRESHLLGSQYLEGIYKLAVHVSHWRDFTVELGNPHSGSFGRI